jgi:hypothetical protein
MQNDLMHLIIENEMRRVSEHQQPRHQDRDSSYSEFLATHPPIFVDAMDPLEVDNRLRAIESKFWLLHCTEF